MNSRAGADTRTHCLPPRAVCPTRPSQFARTARGFLRLRWCTNSHGSRPRSMGSPTMRAVRA